MYRKIRIDAACIYGTLARQLNCCCFKAVRSASRSSRAAGLLIWRLAIPYPLYLGKLYVLRGIQTAKSNGRAELIV